MTKDAKQTHGSWVSLILRLMISSLFIVAAISKFRGGLQGVVIYFQETFKETWLPAPLVVWQAKAAPFIEAIIPVWLIVGLKLRLAWAFTSLFMLSLAFGMMVVGKYDVAANNYFYTFVCVVGLYFSQFDQFSVDGLNRQEE